MKRFSFNPTISFDGVAIIASVIMLGIWAGQIKEQVAQTAKEVAHHEEQLQKLNETTAVLTALMADRDKHTTLK